MVSKKQTKPSMSVRQFAALKGVSRQAVNAAIERGDIPPSATCWKPQGKGKRKVLMIVDVQMAAKAWTPQASQGPTANGGEHLPSTLNGSTSMADANRLLTIAKAKQAQLEYDRASGLLIEVSTVMDVYGRQIAQAKTAIMGLGKLARSRIPHLTVEDVITIEDLCREALEGLVAEALERIAPEEAKADRTTDGK